MNKNGFTLTELLAVIAIIGIISLIAIPNIVNISDNIKRDNMLDDAKRFISVAKYEVNSSYDTRNFINEDLCDQENLSCKFYIELLNKSGDFKTDTFDNVKKIVDPDGLGYDNGSYVKYFKSGDTIKYCIYLVGERRFLGKSTITDVNNCSEENCCVLEDDLTSKEIVHVK